MIWRWGWGGGLMGGAGVGDHSNVDCYTMLQCCLILNCSWECYVLCERCKAVSGLSKTRGIDRAQTGPLCYNVRPLDFTLEILFLYVAWTLQGNASSCNTRGIDRTYPSTLCYNARPLDFSLEISCVVRTLQGNVSPC